MVRKRAWRVGPEKVEALRSAARKFVGTHNFHNFTVGRDFKEKSCMRHMKTIEVRFSALKATLTLVHFRHRCQTQSSMVRRNGSVLCFMDKVLCCIRSDTSTIEL